VSCLLPRGLSEGKEWAMMLHSWIGEEQRMWLHNQHEIDILVKVYTHNCVQVFPLSYGHHSTMTNKSGIYSPAFLLK
jgi:hypothetical protein